MSSSSTPVRMPALDGATGWLNSEPLRPSDLRGHVVLVDFWTLTCINWLRTRRLRRCTKGRRARCPGRWAPHWCVDERGEPRDGVGPGAEAEHVASALRAGNDVAHVAEPVPAGDDR
jgi:hypothetical protein